MKKLAVLLLLISLLLPAAALAVTEGVVESAPQMDMEQIEIQTQSVYLPDASYYADYARETEWERAEKYVQCLRGDDGLYQDVEQRPRLTAGETIRAKKLLSAYQAGEATGDGAGVLEKMEYVTVGVYALDPEDYDGETAFVLLPGTCLTDEQILSVIDAFDRLGLVFDPEGLNYRNCMRGGGIEATRNFAQEETQREMQIRSLMQRGVLPEAKAQTLRCPKLVASCYSGLMDFGLRPYRRLTDEELVSWVAAPDVWPIEISYSEVEREARALLTQTFGCPLSMELTNVYPGGSYMPNLFDADGRQYYGEDVRNSYGAYFTFTDSNGVRYTASNMMDAETREMVAVSVTQNGSALLTQYEDLSQVDEEVCVETAKTYAAKYGFEAEGWRMSLDDVFVDWGNCAVVRARLDETHWINVYVGISDGAAHGIEIITSTQVAPPVEKQIYGG